LKKVLCSWESPFESCLSGRSRWRLPQSRDRGLQGSTHYGYCVHGSHLLPMDHDRRNASTPASLSNVPSAAAIRLPSPSPSAHTQLALVERSECHRWFTTLNYPARPPLVRLDVASTRPDACVWTRATSLSRPRRPQQFRRRRASPRLRSFDSHLDCCWCLAPWRQSPRMSRLEALRRTCHPVRPLHVAIPGHRCLLTRKRDVPTPARARQPL